MARDHQGQRPRKHGAITKHLKQDHGLTHGFANLVAHKTLEAGKTPAAGDDLVAVQYTGPKAGLRPIYDAVMARVEKLGTDVEISPKKSYVSVRRNKQFALVQASTRTRVDVGLNLKGEATTARLEASGSGITSRRPRPRTGRGKVELLDHGLRRLSRLEIEPIDLRSHTDCGPRVPTRPRRFRMNGVRRKTLSGRLILLAGLVLLAAPAFSQSPVGDDPILQLGVVNDLGNLRAAEQFASELIERQPGSEPVEFQLNRVDFSDHELHLFLDATINGLPVRGGSAAMVAHAGSYEVSAFGHQLLDFSTLTEEPLRAAGDAFGIAAVEAGDVWKLVGKPRQVYAVDLEGVVRLAWEAEVASWNDSVETRHSAVVDAGTGALMRWEAADHDGTAPRLTVKNNMFTPPKVSDVKLEKTSCNHFIASWTSVANANKYELWIGSSANSPTTRVKTIIPGFSSVPSGLCMGVTLGGSMYVFIRACNTTLSTCKCGPFSKGAYAPVSSCDGGGF